MRDDFQKVNLFLGMGSWPAFMRQAEGNDCIVRFFQTLKKQLLWVRTFRELEEPLTAVSEFHDRYNRECLNERFGFQSPQQDCSILP